MSDAVNNNTGNGDNQAEKSEKFGCGAWLGLLVLLSAVGAVLFFLVIKPVLEKNQDQLADKWNTVREQAADTLEKGSEAVSKTRQAVSKLGKTAGETKENISETAEDVRKKTEDIREKADQANEAVSNIKNDVKKQADDLPESWY